jgi:hypothetical protein
MKGQETIDKTFFEAGFLSPAVSACPARNDPGGIKGEDIQCENLSESGVLIAEGIKFQTDAYL